MSNEILRSIARIVSERGITFVALSARLSLVDKIWPTFLFFLVVIIFGVCTQIVATDACCCMIVNLFPNSKHPKRMKNITCVVVILLQLGIIVVCGAEEGRIMLDCVHNYGGSWAACVIVVTEMLIAFLGLGFHVFMINIEIMMGTPMPKTFQLAMKYYIGPFLLVSFVLMTIALFQTPKAYIDIPQKSRWMWVLVILLNFIPIGILFGFAVFASRSAEKVTPQVGATKHDLPRSERAAGLEYARSAKRRKSIFSHAQTYSSKPVPSYQAYHSYFLHIGCKKDFENVVRYKTAKRKWLKIFNQIVLHNTHFDSLYKVTAYILREKNQEKDLIEIKLLKKVLSKCSLNHIFETAEVEFDADENRQPQTYLDRILNSSSLKDCQDESQISYFPNEPRYGLLFERIVGRSPPSEEEILEAIIIRVRKDLNEDYSRNFVTLQNLRKRKAVERRYESCGRHDYPLQLSVTLKANISNILHCQRKLHIIVVNECSEFLHKLSVPCPLRILIAPSDIIGKTEVEVQRYIKHVAVQNMAYYLLRDEARGIKHASNPKIEDTVDVVQHNLNPGNTCVVVLLNHDTDSMPWLQPTVKRNHHSSAEIIHFKRTGMTNLAQILKMQILEHKAADRIDVQDIKYEDSSEDEPESEDRKKDDYKYNESGRSSSSSDESIDAQFLAEFLANRKRRRGTRSVHYESKSDRNSVRGKFRIQQAIRNKRIGKHTSLSVSPVSTYEKVHVSMQTIPQQDKEMMAYETESMHATWSQLSSNVMSQTEQHQFEIVTEPHWLRLEQQLNNENENLMYRTEGKKLIVEPKLAEVCVFATSEDSIGVGPNDDSD